MIAQRDGRIEGVHIDVQNCAAGIVATQTKVTGRSTHLTATHLGPSLVGMMMHIFTVIISMVIILTVICRYCPDWSATTWSWARLGLHRRTGIAGSRWHVRALDGAWVRQALARQVPTHQPDHRQVD